MKRNFTEQRRRAFTLVEMLVVIAIISILAALTSVVVLNALWSAKQARIKIEVDAMDAAFKAYKEKYGSYPPCDLQTGNVTAYAALKLHVQRAFPRYDVSQLANDLSTAGIDTTNYNPAQALVFWLSGFSPDVTHPFSYNANIPLTPLFPFDKTRLVLSATGVPQGYTAPGTNVPYVYIDSRNYTANAAVAQPARAKPFPYPVADTTSKNIALPYALDVNKDGLVTVTGTNVPVPDTWVNADSFQIISAGQDDLFGDQTAAAATYPVKLFPSGRNYDSADDDNVTNFNSKSNLNDARPK